MKHVVRAPVGHVARAPWDVARAPWDMLQGLLNYFRT